MLQRRLPLRAQAVVFNISDVLGVTDTGVRNFGSPCWAKLALVLCIEQPAVGVDVRVGILVTLVVTDPGAVHFPEAHRVAEPAPLCLMKQTPLFDVSGSVKRVIVGREIEIDRLRNVDAAPAVTANIWEQQACFAARVCGEANPG